MLSFRWKQKTKFGKKNTFDRLYKWILLWMLLEGWEWKGS